MLSGKPSHGYNINLYKNAKSLIESRCEDALFKLFWNSVIILLKDSAHTIGNTIENKTHNCRALKLSRIIEGRKFVILLKYDIIGEVVNIHTII